MQPRPPYPNGISFSVPKGRLFTLLGPSGCGKTTTLRCIAGLERPQGGVIAVDGETHVDAARGIFVAPDKRGIGMVFQSYAIWPHMTVYQNVAYALEALTFLPWAFPSTALAIGLLWGYVQLPLPIYATIWILLIAYVTRFLPYGLRPRHAREPGVGGACRHRRPLRPAHGLIWRYRARGYTMKACISKGGVDMRVAKWGNSLAVRLPASVVEALGLKEGDDIEIHVAGRRSFELAKKPGARELLARLRKFRGRLPADFRFDRLEANERT